MVSKRFLIGIAAFVWMIAGFNVLRLGMLEYWNRISLVIVLLTGIVFIPFFFMFLKMVSKNTKRILNMQESTILFLKFFTVKSYVLIACMMSFGMILRNIERVPRSFIAFFYTGLGAALFCAGIKYAYYLIRYEKLELELLPLDDSTSK